jgi:hypothetical protein
VVARRWRRTGRPGGEIVGEDAGNLIPDAVIDHFITADQMPRLEQVVFDGYLRGLQAAGWDDDPRLIQLGMWSSAVKYDWLAALTLAQVHQDRQYRATAEPARSTPPSSSDRALAIDRVWP